MYAQMTASLRVHKEGFGTMGGQRCELIERDTNAEISTYAPAM